MTPRQRDLYEFIDAYIFVNGCSPSFEEMKQSLGVKSKSNVDRLMKGLKEQGKIDYTPHKARTVEVV